MTRLEKLTTLVVFSALGSLISALLFGAMLQSDAIAGTFLVIGFSSALVALLLMVIQVMRD